MTDLAARLCADARSGEILISSHVLATIEGLAEAEAVGEKPLKGSRQPVPVFNVKGLLGGVDRRGEAAATGPSAGVPAIGRDVTAR